MRQAEVEVAGSRQIIVLLRVKIVIWERKSPAFEFDSRHLTTFMLNLKKKKYGKENSKRNQSRKVDRVALCRIR